MRAQIVPIVFLFLLTLSAAGQTPEKSPPPNLMTPELLWKLGRLGDADISKNGQTAAFTVRSYDLKSNDGKSSLSVVDLKTGVQRKLLSGWPSISDVQFAPSPFGERIYLIGRADAQSKKQDQIWAINPADGGALQLSAFKDGCANLKVAPDGRNLAYTLDVKLDKEPKEIYEDLPKADARIIDSLMYRHWNAWHDYKYSHIHLAPIKPDGKAGKGTDILGERRVDSPVPPFGGISQFDWSPDGNFFAYTLKDQQRWAESTNSDIYLLDVASGQDAINISVANKGYDNDPLFSPDGKSLAYHSMEHDGFESDRNRIMVYNLASKQITEATKGLDQTVHDTHWTPDSKGFVFASEHRGSQQLFSIGRDAKGLRQVSEGRFEWSLRGLSPDGKKALVSFARTERPDELAVLDLASKSSRTLSHINDKIYATLKLPTVKERWVEATDGKKIHCWVVYPPDFDPSKKWPMLTYCQGGPQGQIGQWFSYRWNFHLMAANGYVVLAPNRRGLPGFGREWNDQISGDWGGQPMDDLLSATDSMLAEPYIDSKRAAAVGASFGGYSVYWLMGHHAQRFATMVSHCGVFNLESMYGTTEELFFANWEFGGPYWKSPAIQKKYDEFSPNRYVKNWDTPLLVIHNEKDFRVPIGQGMEAFSAAQIQGIPSRFLYFPEEGHWVTKPQNSVLWNRVFFEWLDRYCKEPVAG